VFDIGWTETDAGATATVLAVETLEICMGRFDTGFKVFIC
jgi:hypothetical protein